MEHHLRKEANKAHKQEIRAERKEARLHNRAVNAALHGNVGRAVRLEQRSINQHHRAEAAHAREVNARHTANVIHHNKHQPSPPHYHQPPAVHVHHHHVPPPHVHHHAPPHKYPPSGHYPH